MLAYILDRSNDSTLSRPELSQGRCYVAVYPEVIPHNYREDFRRIAEKAEKDEKDGGEVDCREFYQMQSKHELGDKKDVVKVPIWISHSNKDRLTQSDIPVFLTVPFKDLSFKDFSYI